VSLIYWDTMLFVYQIEDRPEYRDRIHRIYKGMTARGDRLCTSLFTVGELLAGFYSRGAADRAIEIREGLRSGNIEFLRFDEETADLYGRIRGTQRVSSADAIHLACAAQRGVDLFLTTDHRLRKLVVPGIDFIAGLDVNLF
jgi:predicted nucleic acid-binding protein